MKKTKKKTILILDDTKPIRILLLKRLETKYNCLLASHPFDAIQLVKEYENEIALIITDYQMPDLNGYEFLMRIQSVAQRVPVILLSSQLTELRIKELYLMGVRIFMAKPIDIDRLIKEIEKLLDKSVEEEDKEE